MTIFSILISQQCWILEFEITQVIIKFFISFCCKVQRRAKMYLTLTGTFKHSLNFQSHAYTYHFSILISQQCWILEFEITQVIIKFFISFCCKVQRRAKMYLTLTGTFKHSLNFQSHAYTYLSHHHALSRISKISPRVRHETCHSGPSCDKESTVTVKCIIANILQWWPPFLPTAFLTTASLTKRWEQSWSGLLSGLGLGLGFGLELGLGLEMRWSEMQWADK